MDNIFTRLHKEHCYSIALRPKGEKLLFEGNRTAFRVLPITRDVWYADPMLFAWNGVEYLFCEAYDRNADYGYIAVTELDSDTPKTPRKVLDIGQHLSYPCVFERNGQIYMIPETTTQKNVQLFRATKFPDEWEFVAELEKDNEFADSTYFQIDNQAFLLLFEQYCGNGSITKLSVCDAKEIDDGILTPFPSYEFTFSEDSRGAGNVFQHNGKLIRPAQICTPDYGYGLKFMEISLVDNIYEEQPIGAVCPEELEFEFSKPVIGIHTYGIGQQYEVIDVKFNDPKLKHQLKRIWRRIVRK